MKQKFFETIIGFVVILIASSSFFYAYKLSGRTSVDDFYTIEAHFQNIDGLSEGGEVKLSGIKIGEVNKITLDNAAYFAIVKLNIKKNVELPIDSRASISTTGLIGGKYVRIIPGASEENMSENSKLVHTQSALNIEDLIAKLMYSITSK